MVKDNERKIHVKEELISDFIPKKFNEDERKFKYPYTIPKFQRYFVWDYKEIKDLWDSIYRNYPIGSFIIWESEKKLPDNREISDDISFIPTDSKTYKYILDGQQRITSLIVSILGANKTSPNRKRPIDFTIYLSLKQAKKEIEEKDLEEKKKIQLFFTKKEKDKLPEDEKKYLVKVNKLIEKDSEIWKKFYKEGEEDIGDLYNSICDRLKTKYKLSIINLQNIPIEEVCELFTRVNIKGKKLSTIDLITANTFKDGFYLRDYLESLYGESGDLDKLNYSDLDEILFIRLISMIKNKSCKESDLFNITSEEFKDNWEKASDSLKEAIKFLQKMNITSPKIFPYSPMIVSLSYFFYLLRGKTIDEETKRYIKNWFWIKSFNGDYQGATNEEIRNDCQLFKKFIDKEGNFKFNLTTNLTPERILSEKINFSSGFCKSILSLMANMFPRDFTNHNEVNIYDVLIRYKKSELHHIFPKKSSIGKKESEEEINSIVNICFLPKESNQKISNDNPSDYFNKKVKKVNETYYQEDLKTNLIPSEENSAIWNNNFKKFLIDRAKLINNRIKELTNII